MLVLTRKEMQSIMIPDEIEITVLRIMGEKVSIGIDAPRSTPIYRKELYLDIQDDLARGDDPKVVKEALDRLKSP